MVVPFVHLSLLAYLAAGGCYLAWLLKPHDFSQRWGRRLLVSGALVHLAALVTEYTQSGADPFWRPGGSLSLMAFLIVTGFLALDFKRPIPVVGAFISPLVVAVLVPAHLVPDRASAVYGAGLVLHVGTAILGTAAFALSFGLSLLFLLVERQVKARRLGRLAARLPSLELVERLAWRLTLAGFVFLSSTIALGKFFAQRTGALDLKTALAYVAWFTYAVVINARLMAGWRGRRAAFLVLAGFLLIVGVYLGLYRSSAYGAII